MGNKIARTTQASATEYYLHDLPSSYNLVLKEVLGRDRFLKSILCKHDEGLVLVKVYFKRGDSIDLREYERRISRIRDIFSKLDHSHVWPFQFWLETDKAAYLVRQYFFNNLHDRISTRPFLNVVEKKWLAFQLLYAVKQSHENGVCHGDIKCENVLVTSWNWLYLTDFASFKPTYIPYDDPSDFSFFFDTGGRRRCYVAPERFYEHGGEMQMAQEAPLKHSMDIFAVGCVIAELFLEGQPLFELSQLLAYRRGQYDPSVLLEKIPDPGIRKMILHMIQLDPESRCSAESYLQNYADVVFPSYFSPFLHKFYSLLNPLSSDARVIACETSFQEILRQVIINKASKDIIHKTETFSDDSCEMMQPTDLKQDLQMADNSVVTRDVASSNTNYEVFDILADVSSQLGGVKKKNCKINSVARCVHSKNQKQKQHALQSPGVLTQNASSLFQRSNHPFLKKITLADLSSLSLDDNNQTDALGLPFLPLPKDIIKSEGMVLIASLLCSCIRNVKIPFIRRAAVLLLKSCAVYIDDEDRLQRILPYVIAVLSDPAAIVRCAALETLCDILPLIRDFPPSDAKIFPEYILPMLSMLPDDPEESVRICYASNISKLALTAYGFLVHSMSLTEAGVLNETNLSRKPSKPIANTSMEFQRLNIDAQLAQLRNSIAEVIQELVMGQKQTPNIRRALLNDIGNLCWFLGQKQSNDFLLPVLPAFLNDRDEQLRAVFYEEIIYVCFFVGQRSVEEYLLPYIEQALNDTTESVIVNALDCLTILCRSNFLRKRILLEMIERAFPLLCYPIMWVRTSVVTFIAASSENLGAVDSYVFLVPVVRPFLRRQPASLASEKALLTCLKPPVTKERYYEALQNARSSDMLDRQRKIWYTTSLQAKQFEGIDLFQKTASELDPIKCWPDEQNETQHYNFIGSTGERGDLMSSHVNESKFKAMGSLAPNASILEGAHDNAAAEKSQLSGFMSPQMSCMNSFIDKSSESIPLYYFKVDNRRGVSTTPAARDTSLPYSSFGFSSSSLPWMDPVNKSFSLTSSIPAPKLVSGSAYANNSPALLRRVVHEVEDRETDEAAYIGNKFCETGLAEKNKGSSLTRDDHSHSAETTGLPSIAWSSTVPDSGWRPRGVLVAHLQEHKAAVNNISVSMDQLFFVSASEDSAVKIWDCKKLEKDISFRSRLTYSLGGSRGLCVAVLQGSTQIVVGASDGTIHMFSVDHISRGLGNVVENYSGIADVKKSSSEEGAVLSLLNYTGDGSTSKMILYSTQNCGIHLWDTRTSSSAWYTKVSPGEGYVSSLVADPCGNWFVSGSSRGVLTLWDLRFCIPVNSWQCPVACPIENMCPFVPPSGTPLSVATRPLVYVAAGCNEVSLWNAENGSCHQVMRVANSEGDAEYCESPWALNRSPGKPNSKSDPRRNSKYRVDELNEPSPRYPGVRALLPLPGGDLLTGGTDLKIRRWDHCSPERSYSVCGPSIKGVGADEFYETKSSFGVQVVQESKRRPLSTRLTGKAIMASATSDSAGCHHDSILSLASVKLNQRLLISSSRDGAIKVWK